MGEIEKICQSMWDDFKDIPNQIKDEYKGAYVMNKEAKKQRLSDLTKVYPAERYSVRLYKILKLNTRIRHTYPVIASLGTLILMKTMKVSEIINSNINQVLNRANLKIIDINNNYVELIICGIIGVTVIIQIKNIKKNTRLYFRKKMKITGFINKDFQLPKFIRSYSKDNLTIYYFKSPVNITHWQLNMNKLEMIFNGFIDTIEPYKGRTNYICIKITKTQKTEKIIEFNSSSDIECKLTFAFNKLNIPFEIVAHDKKEFNETIEFNSDVNINELMKHKDNIAHRAKLPNMKMQQGNKGDYKIIVQKSIGTIDFYEFLKKVELNQDNNICLGLDTDSNYQMFDIKKLTHILIAGSTGGGKSNVGNVFLASLYKAGLKNVAYVLLDPKKAELKKFRSLDNTVYADENEDMLNVLIELHKEMKRRAELIGQDDFIKDIESWNRQKPENPMNYTVIVIEEVASLVLNNTAEYVKEFKKVIQDITQFGRSMGFRMVLCTQYPLADVISTTIRMNALTRFIFAADSARASNLMLDNTMAYGLKTGESIIQNNGINTKTKIFWIDDSRDKMLIYELKGKYQEKNAINSNVRDTISTLSKSLKSRVSSVPEAPDNTTFHTTNDTFDKENKGLSLIKSNFSSNQEAKIPDFAGAGAGADRGEQERQLTVGRFGKYEINNARELLIFYRQVMTEDFKVPSVAKTAQKTTKGKTMIQKYRQELKNKGFMITKGQHCYLDPEMIKNLESNESLAR